MQALVENRSEEGYNHFRNAGYIERSGVRMIELQGSDWGRDDLVEKYRDYDFPYINIGASMDVTNVYHYAKEKGLSFYTVMIYAVTHVANGIKNFHYRFTDDFRPVYIEKLTASFTYLPKGEENFYVVEYPYEEDMESFARKAKAHAERVKDSGDHAIMHQGQELGLLYISALPWIDYTHFVRTVRHGGKDNIPRISWGKYTWNEKGRLMMTVSLQVHHGLMDGYHVGRFFMELEKWLSEMQK